MEFFSNLFSLRRAFVRLFGSATEVVAQAEEIAEKGWQQPLPCGRGSARRDKQNTDSEQRAPASGFRLFAGSALLFAVVLSCGACWGQAITIVNSGSTNRAGFQIAVQPSGDAEYTSQPRRGEAAKHIDKTVSKSLTRRLHDDVTAAQPLGALPAPHCAKSASFGSRTFVEVGDQQSPDLSCGDGGDAKLRALIRDVNEVVAMFGKQP